MTKLISIINSIDNMEQRGHLLIVDQDGKCGIICHHNLALHLSMCYVTRINWYARTCGGIKRFLHALHIMPTKWVQEHDPDLELKNLCAYARIVINYRRSVALGEQGISFDQSALFPDTEPLYITMMNDDNTAPLQIGYQLADTIILEKPQES